MTGAEVAAIIMGGIGAVTGIAALVISYRSAKFNAEMVDAAHNAFERYLKTFDSGKQALFTLLPDDQGRTVKGVIDEQRTYLIITAFNKGPAWAYDVHASATLFGLTFESRTVPAMGPNSSRDFEVPIDLELLPRRMNTEFWMKVNYEDGNGLAGLTIRAKIEGPEENRIDVHEVRPVAPVTWGGDQIP